MDCSQIDVDQQIGNNYSQEYILNLWQKMTQTEFHVELYLSVCLNKQ